MLGVSIIEPYAADLTVTVVEDGDRFCSCNICIP